MRRSGPVPPASAPPSARSSTKRPESSVGASRDAAAPPPDRLDSPAIPEICSIRPSRSDPPITTMVVIAMSMTMSVCGPCNRGIT